MSREQKQRQRSSASKQDDVVDALYAFATAIGAPIQNAEGYEIDGRRGVIVPALEQIMNIFGYRVVEIQ